MQNKVISILEAQGVNIYRGFHIHEIKTDSSNEICNQIVIRKKADNYEETLKLIQEKDLVILPTRVSK